MVCLFIIGVAIVRGGVQTLVNDSQQCLIPMSPRQVGMDPYDPIDFARFALSMIGQGDIIGQSYVCWPQFLSETDYPKNLRLRMRILSALYSYLPTSNLRASVRDDFLLAVAMEYREMFSELDQGILETGEGPIESITFTVRDGMALHVGLMAEGGLRYVSSIKFVLQKEP
jgi:hypothetical protein